MAFYIATAWSCLGVCVALTFPPLDEQRLAAEADAIAARRAKTDGAIDDTATATATESLLSVAPSRDARGRLQ